MEINGKNYTIGADPEIFMGHNGQFVSAHNAVPGSKAMPHYVDKGAVQVDGMALEFNIDPADNFDQFQDNLDTVQEILKEMIGENEFLNTVSVNFDEKFMEGIPSSALELGCSADYDGWTMNETPKPDAKEMMRTAGGHIHIGGFFSEDPFRPDHYIKSARLARILDYTLGVYSILWDKDDKRRSMYGKAGSFRPKSYGMEYRTLSNKWIFDPTNVKFVYESVVDALNLFEDPDFEPDESVKDIINSSDRNSSFFVNNPKVNLIGV